jgi:glutamate synthase (NADPH/NADH) large chain
MLRKPTHCPFLFKYQGSALADSMEPRDKCALCGQCTAVCPVNAIELGDFPQTPLSPQRFWMLDTPGGVGKYVSSMYHGIRQLHRPGLCLHWAVPCCSMVCPNDAIMPLAQPMMRTNCACTTSTGAAIPGDAAGGATVSRTACWTELKFIRISMLTDPALDAGRHEFELRTLLGSVLPPEENLKFHERTTAGFRRFGKSTR